MGWGYVAVRSAIADHTATAVSTPIEFGSAVQRTVTQLSSNSSIGSEDPISLVSLTELPLFQDFLSTGFTTLTVVWRSSDKAT